MKPLALLPIGLLACGGGQTPEPFGVPITGGTMIVTNDGARAVVADPDRDRIVTVDIATGDILATVTLTAGDEPGRLVEDAAGRVHVALRRGGQIVTVDSAGIEIGRRFACAEPRGIAFDAAINSIHLACTGGELLTFPADGGDATRNVRLDRDLRDVIVRGDELIVTRFRNAEIITLDRQGLVVSRVVPPAVQRFEGGFGGGIPTDGGGAPPPSEPGTVNATASTAWRTIALADGTLVMSHQRKVKNSLDQDQPGGYGGDCGGGPVEDAVTVSAPGAVGGPRAVGQISRAALPVDIAVSRAGDKLAVVSAGNRTVTVVPIAALGAPDQQECPPPPPPCDGDPLPPGDPGTPTEPGGGGGMRDDFPECCERDENGECKDDDDDDEDDDGQERLGPPTSVAFTPTGDLVIFYPEASAIVVRTQAGPQARRISLGGQRANDPGRNVFHKQTQIGLACSSCHPEGRDDGLVWNFAQTGPRRTQSLAGNLLERAPFHWSGDMTNLNVLMDDVFAVRMSGGFLTENQKAALAPWLGRIPAAAPRSVDAAAVERGKAIFDDPSVGCASCHNGGILSNNQLLNVGTGGKFKVPTLIGVGARPPFMHDGCAQSLMDRFLVCGNSNLHGNTTLLNTTQLTDLVEYLESL